MSGRQMKFRAWIRAEYIGEETGVMHTAEADEDFRLVGDAKGFGLINGDFNYVPEQHFEVMQWTGLKDKNGTDIYEGDIVRLGQVNATVEWDEDLACFYLRETYNHELDEADKLEVLGNIYENPDLLAA